MVANYQQSNIWAKPVQVQQGEIWQLDKHRLMCGNSTSPDDVARLLQGEKVDLCFADPPYGIGIDVWDKRIEDVSAFIELITSHLKQGGFFAFTHQMPYMMEWLDALQHSTLKYKDHVMWVKRSLGAVAQELLRTHESLFIYSKEKAKYHQTKGYYEDVKLPRVLVDVVTLEGIDRYIKDLQRKAKGLDTTKRNNGGNNASYSYMPRMSDRSPEFANFTNVWSFLPEHQSQRKNVTNHATVKPLLLMNRLLELTTPDNALVYDAFMGSGTTLISGQKTGRVVYGMELSPDFCGEIIQRWQVMTGQHAYRWENTYV